MIREKGKENSREDRGAKKEKRRERSKMEREEQRREEKRREVTGREDKRRKEMRTEHDFFCSISIISSLCALSANACPNCLALHSQRHTELRFSLL